MYYYQKSFQENELAINNKYFKYYLSPILLKNNFKHGFFTKTSSEINLSLLSNHLNLSTTNCVLNQIHSNQIVLGSKTLVNEKVEADGMINDKLNQNLWIYTADCMPILFADKTKRLIAAIHCGRKGLEKKIINNIIKKFYNKGCLKEDLLIAIGPSISQKYYLIDYKTLDSFQKKAVYKKELNCSKVTKIFLNLKTSSKLNKKDSIPLNLKKYAYIQLLNENIPSTNIDISNLCTYESNHNFYSWRRSKTSLRQWNFISS
tara:strand:+ start:375 stop:1157 length:783 start_codon:yes stop_codon:yes gene_type:complete